jgi:RNA polymerase sigma factor (sigma-70 family)
MSLVNDPIYDLHIEDIKRIDQQRKKKRKDKPVYYTREEEAELHAAYKAGDKEAGEKLMLSQLKLVVSIGNKFKNSPIPSEFHKDLTSTGYEGLITALDTFKPEKGTFPTWVRKCVTTTLILFMKKVNKFSDKIEGRVESGNRVLHSEDGSDTEVFDLIEDTSTNEAEEKAQQAKIVREIIEALPLRDRQICELYFFQGKRKKDLPYLLTPIYENEWANIEKYGKNILNFSFVNGNGEKNQYTFEILVFTSNEESNENLLENTDDVKWLSHRYQKTNKKFERETFSVELLNVQPETINIKLNGKNLDFTIEENILSTNLLYKVGFICSDINSRLEKTLDKLRTNPQILALSDI